MRRNAVMLVTAAAVLALAGCCAGTVPGAERVERCSYLFRGTGTAMVAKPGDELSILEARIAAAAMAKADLLEKIRGATVTGQVTVDSLMFEKQETVVAVEGHLARATVTYGGEGDGPAAEPATSITATAELALSCRQLRRLEDYAE